MKSRRLLFLVLLISLAIPALVWKRAAAPVPLPGPAYSQRNPARARRPVPAAAVPPAPSSKAQSADPSLPEPPHELRQVLPNLPRGVTDWRTFAPPTIAIRLLADQPAVEFTTTSIREVAGHTVWVGRNGIAGAFLVTVAQANLWQAVITVPGEPIREVTITGQRVEVREKFGTKLACINPNSRAEERPARTTSHAATANPSGGIYYSDVAFAYTANGWPTNGVLSPQEMMEATGISVVECANQLLINSGVTNLRWRYVAARQVPDYPQTTRMQDDLNALANPNTALGRFAAEQGALLHADQAVLFVGAPRRTDSAGVAELPGHYAVIDNGDPTLSYLTVAHEMSHNFGCWHDRATVVSQSGGRRGQAGDGLYCYGYKFTSADSREMGTVMSYARNILPYFSTPDVTWNGVALGVPPSDPLAAFDARTLTETAATMANTQVSLVPEITAQPQRTTVVAGGSLELTVAATGPIVSYQWRKNGVSLADATSSTLTVASVAATDSGSYDCIVASAATRVVSQPATVFVVSGPPDSSARLANLSTRSWVGVGNEVEIAGFVIAGTGTKTVLLRAAGPALAAFGVSGALSDPQLRLVDQKTGITVVSNDDWSDDAETGRALIAAFNSTGAFAFADGSNDAALLVALNPGAYTAIVSGKDNSAGVALVEAYEFDRTENARLINLSTRSEVRTGYSVQIAGFVIRGTGSKQVLLRAAGPALSAFGVSGVLGDPTITLYDQSTQQVLAISDNWTPDLAPVFAQAGAFSWSPESLDTALLATLAPGAYTAVVTGNPGTWTSLHTTPNDTSGVALIEIYEIN